MTRDLHSVSSDETEKHGLLYNFFAGIAEKLDRLYEKFGQDEAIRDNPELPFSSPTPGEAERGPLGAHENNAK